MVIKRIVIERGSILDLQLRGYWNPEIKTAASAFAAQPKVEQDQVVVTCKRVGYWSAVELVPSRKS
jgi:hypothetical protein